jgi:Ca-activated chloride channel family protein
MAIALLRPYIGATDVTIPTSTDDYMFIVDVSRSMYAKDVSPSRIGLAKRKLKDLIDEFARQGVPHRYGITLFAGYSYLLCPVTDDIAVVKQFIDEISPEMVSSLGSNLEAGVSTALGRFSESDAQSARLLIVSDGEDDRLSLERIIGQLATKKIRVDVLGVGTPAGSPIELDNGSFIRGPGGSVVNSQLAEAPLKQLASATSGLYVRATLDDRDISALVKASRSFELKKKGASRVVRSYNEVGPWLALAALVIILGITGFPRSGTLVRILFLALIPGHLTFAQALETPIPQSVGDARAAFDLYNEGKYSEARELFKSLVKESPTDRNLLQGYASALFKTGEYKEAQKIFNSLASQTTKGREYFENTYNEGNALLAMKRYQEAVDAYTKALDIKPDDERALHNRTIAKALLEEQKRKAKEPTPTPTPTPPQNPEQSPQASPPPQSSPDSSDDQKQQEKDTDKNQDQNEEQKQEHQPSPQPGEQPTPKTNATPQNGEQTPQASPSAAPDQQAPGSASPHPEGTPSAEPSPQGNEESENDRLKENLDQGAPPPADQTPSAQESAQIDDSSDPSRQEADAWLESLPDSPLLIRRERGRRAPGGQTW